MTTDSAPESNRHPFSFVRLRLSTRRWRLIGGTASILIALIAQQQVGDSGVRAGLLFALASILAVVAFWGVDDSPYSPQNLAKEDNPRRARRFTKEEFFVNLRGLFLIGQSVNRVAWSLLAVALALAALATWRFYELPPDNLAWTLHLASLAALIVAAYAFDARRDLAASRDTWSRWEVVAGVGILALAILLRVYRLNELPFGIWYDEAEYGLEALRILDDPAHRPIFVGAINGPAHYLYLVAAAFKLFGISIQAVRGVNVLLGIATVPAIYLVARELFNRRSGLVAAALVAVSSWAVTLSRFGMHSTSTTPLFALLTIGFLLRGLRTRRASDFMWSGLWLGMGLNFYTSFRLVVPVVGLFVLHWWVTQWWSEPLPSPPPLRRAQGPGEGTVDGASEESASPSDGANITNEKSAPPPTGGRLGGGFFLLALAALLVTAPLILFALTQPDIFWARVQKTFIFADKLPHERLPALLDNVRVHLLMFNVRGDPNGRHNLPGRPMLDAISGALLVLGAALAAVRVRRPRWALLLLWPAWTLLGGILSLSFEAPQSLRANGALPAAYLLAVVPIYLLGKVWNSSERGGPRDAVSSSKGMRISRYLPALLILALLVPAAILNYRAYFVDWATDFAAWSAWSTSQTIAANLLADLDDDTTPYLISYLDNHPTLRFAERMARERGRRGPAWDYRRIETTDLLPLAWPDSGDVLLIFNADSRNLHDEARALYPDAASEEIAPDFGSPVIYTVRLTREDIESIEGLRLAIYPGDAESSGEVDPRNGQITRTLALNLAELAAAEAKLAPPFTVEWTGVLRVADYGPHRFFVDAPTGVTLWIDEEPILQPGQIAAGVTLAIGNHALRLRAVVPENTKAADVDLGAPLTVSWQTPTGTPQILGGDALYHDPVTANGLLGTYYANGKWQSPPAYERIDRDFGVYYHLPELPRPYTVEWTGKLAATQSGRYGFALESIDESTLWIGGQEIVASPNPNELREAVVELEAGLHDVRLRFADRTDHTHLNWYWTPPGGAREIVPSAVLFPPRGSYEQITLPHVDAADLDAANFQSGAALIPAVEGSGEVEVVASGLDGPAGVATLGQRVYVTESNPETGTARLLVLDGDGQRLRSVSEISLNGEETPLIEPFDLAASEATQTLYLLDAGLPALLVFDTDGRFRQRLAVDEQYLLSSRGLAVEPIAKNEGDGDRLWIAATRLGAAVAVDGKTGQVVQEIPIVSEGESDKRGQPVDVAVLPTGLMLDDNRLFVADASLSRLWNFTGAGMLWQNVGLPVANTLNGPHLAADRQGGLYVTEPEAARLVRYDFAAGQATFSLSYWPLPTVDPNGNEALRKPVGVAVDDAGTLWIADRGAGELLRLEPE